jgi:hypothetical protein
MIKQQRPRIKQAAFLLSTLSPISGAGTLFSIIKK